MKLVVASRNADKFREIQEKLSDLPIELVSLAEFPSLAATIEDQPDLIGNSIKKAREAHDGTGLWAMADDTGLEVEALGGAPGVYTARFAGENATYADNCRKMLREMSGVPSEKRVAHFKTVIALKTHDGLHCVEGILPGRIAFAERGQKGFGYDPVFELADGRTLAELELAEKNRLSHRGQAVEKMKILLEWMLSESQRD
ncbi:MAG: RdgB/HAM1 family non-canonical purine NTP pyrophosphatase [Calditrichaeota bacterium]|nr:RdgB/HAM1 family non-canonical purine NTP pyrophosphatase [Calditrichota bacterium]MCB9366354.1 RdgB/HAM1 family non-canonical purine NTP pyrophosphatase [Calditrichota bacterium]